MSGCDNQTITTLFLTTKYCHSLHNVYAFTFTRGLCEKSNDVKIRTPNSVVCKIFLRCSKQKGFKIPRKFLRTVYVFLASKTELVFCDKKKRLIRDHEIKYKWECIFYSNSECWSKSTARVQCRFSQYGSK